MKDTLKKFISRKLIITLITIVTAIEAKQYIAAAITAVAYLIAQGLIDLKTVKEAGKLVSEVEDVLKEVAPLLPDSTKKITKTATAVADSLVEVAGKVK